MAKQPKRLKVRKVLKIPERAPFVTSREAAHHLDCGAQVIRRMVRKGELQGAKIGGRFKITRASLEAVLCLIEGGQSSSSQQDAATPSLAASAE